MRKKVLVLALVVLFVLGMTSMVAAFGWGPQPLCDEGDFAMIKQVGHQNEAMVVQTGQYKVDYICGTWYKAFGGNVAFVNQYGTKHDATVTQIGGENFASVLSTGYRDEVNINQNGQRLTAWVYQSGHRNSADVVQRGVENTAKIMQAGYRNNASINQTGNFDYGKIMQLGSRNNATIIQN